MKNRKKHIITLIGIVVLLVLVVMANIWRHRSLVHGVRVEIDYIDTDTLITPEQVAAIIRDSLPQLTETTLRNVNLEAVEQAASTSPYLSQCQASTSIGGDVILYARQRRPVVRICSSKEEYYLDDHGYKLPESRTGYANVIVASGNLNKGIKEIWTLAAYLDSHSDIAPLFDQIYRDSHGDLYLTPKLGSHVVQVGDTSNLDQKFYNLMALYTRGLPQAGWETYSQVSLKYNKQVVCTKREGKTQ